jgi:site-specific DNA recombinase
MVPTHATKAGIRYRYYVSRPHLHGESKTASVGSVSRVPAAEIEATILEALNKHLVAEREKPITLVSNPDGSKLARERIARIEVQRNQLTIRIKSRSADGISSGDDPISIPWQKPPSRKPPEILIPLGIPRNTIRPIRIERRARLVRAIVRGRRWLDELLSGSVNSVEQIAARQKCSVRQVNMTISLAFLAPALVKAAIEGHLPRGTGVERLRDAPAEWKRQFETLGLRPQ